VTVLRDSIGCGAFFVMIEAGQNYLPAVTGSPEGSFTNNLGSGLMAGFGYWFVSLPFDAIKTLVQTGQSPSAVDTVTLLLNRDGAFKTIRQLYRGWEVAFGRGSPAAAVSLIVYSSIYDFISVSY